MYIGDVCSGSSAFLMGVSGFSGMEWWTGMVDWDGIVEWNGVANYNRIKYLYVTVVSRDQTLLSHKGIIAFNTSAPLQKGPGRAHRAYSRGGGHTHVSRYIMF